MADKKHVKIKKKKLTYREYFDFLEQLNKLFPNRKIIRKEFVEYKNVKI